MLTNNVVGNEFLHETFELGFVATLNGLALLGLEHNVYYCLNLSGRTLHTYLVGVGLNVGNAPLTNVEVRTSLNETLALLAQLCLLARSNGIFVLLYQLGVAGTASVGTAVDGDHQWQRAGNGLKAVLDAALDGGDAFSAICGPT